jgi:8-oxo-dGTP diphosphatase
MDHDKSLRPKVGVGVLVFKDGKVLLGKRKNSHGQGEYAPPGGHMEYMESFEQTAKREVMEETGIEIENVRFLRLRNQKEYTPAHYINVGLAADWKSGEPKIMEPEKIEGWNWYNIDNLPMPLFAGVSTLIEAFETGKNFWDN